MDSNAAAQVQYIVQPKRKCGVCLNMAELTTWLPPGGFDPALREYKCISPGCRVTFYYRSPVDHKQLSRTKLM